MNGCLNTRPDASGARELALSHMLDALAQLDSDASISGVIGARLQSAIDALCGEMGIEPPMPELG